MAMQPIFMAYIANIKIKIKHKHLAGWNHNELVDILKSASTIKLATMSLVDKI
jgi:hypothetical protein